MSQDSSLTLNLKPIGLANSLGLFGSASLALIFATRILIPFLSDVTGQEPILFWFLVAGCGVFTPLLLMAVCLLDQEGNLLEANVWNTRLRFRRLRRIDYFLSLSGIVAILVGTVIITLSLKLIFGEVNLHPPFMAFHPLEPGRYWLLAVWLPFWLLNIMGEEILWRGVILPRQEIKFGRWAWLLNAMGWWLFHLAFGWQLWLTLVPILLIVPYVVQKSQNSWVGVIIHAGINGPGFLAVAFGLV